MTCVLHTAHYPPLATMNTDKVITDCITISNNFIPACFKSLEINCKECILSRRVPQFMRHITCVQHKAHDPNFEMVDNDAVVAGVSIIQIQITNSIENWSAWDYVIMSLPHKKVTLTFLKNLPKPKYWGKAYDKDRYFLQRGLNKMKD